VWGGSVSEGREGGRVGGREGRQSEFLRILPGGFGVFTGVGSVDLAGGLQDDVLAGGRGGGRGSNSRRRRSRV
jgi:hypothetical protein